MILHYAFSFLNPTFGKITSSELAVASERGVGIGINSEFTKLRRILKPQCPRATMSDGLTGAIKTQQNGTQANSRRNCPTVAHRS
jgi:hypothetical protein